MLNDFLSLVKVENFKERYNEDITDNSFFGFPLDSIIETEKRLVSSGANSIAYLSMEYGLGVSFYNSLSKRTGIGQKNKVIDHEVFSNLRIEDFLFNFKIDNIIDLPLYSGGLGVLAGDTIKSAADLGMPIVAIGILWKKGYFKQNFWFKYGQVPEEMVWDPQSYPGLIPLENIIKIDFNKKSVFLRLWKYYVYSFDKKNVIPLVLIDSDIEQNPPQIRSLTHQLYRSGDVRIKIMQRAILGIGAMKALEELGYSISRYHLNEGHAALAFIEKAVQNKEAVSSLKQKFAYTCHTPVAAGHDIFSVKDIEKILSKQEASLLKKFGREKENNNLVNLTLLLLENCDRINGVSKKHNQVMNIQFPRFKDKINSITNGIHVATWVSKEISSLLDRYKDTIGNYLSEPSNLSNITQLRDNKQFRIDLCGAHQENKKRLADIFNRWRIKENVFTLCWARRIAQYKRPSLLFQDINRLLSIAKQKGQIQIIIAGKAHPADNLVGTYINEIMNAIDSLNKEYEYIRVVMLENYDAFFGRLLTSSVDVWLNNPLPPFEASGTSGMKAILNGVIQLSTVDGWIAEISDKNIGRLFGYRHNESDPIGDESNLRLEQDSQELYRSLEELVDLYYCTFREGNINYNSEWVDMMIDCIAQGHYFNTHRMISEYKEKMWSS